MSLKPRCEDFCIFDYWLIAFTTPPSFVAIGERIRRLWYQLTVGRFTPRPGVPLSLGPGGGWQWQNRCTGNRGDARLNFAYKTNHLMSPAFQGQAPWDPEAPSTYHHYLASSLIASTIGQSCQIWGNMHSECKTSRDMDTITLAEAHVGIVSIW